MDNSFTYENPTNDGIINVDNYAAHLKKNNLRFRWSKLPDGKYVVHAADPTGYGIRFVGKAVAPP